MVLLDFHLAQSNFQLSKSTNLGNMNYFYLANMILCMQLRFEESVQLLFSMRWKHAICIWDMRYAIIVCYKGYV